MDQSETFSSREQHRAWLAGQARLPEGFACGTKRIEFVPFELNKPAKMNLTLIRLQRPTSCFAGLYTRNALPGAPVIIGRQRLAGPSLAAVLINNKISNVCAPDGVQTAERLCAAVAAPLGIEPRMVVPCSTGVIGWRLPLEPMLAAMPELAAQAHSVSALDAAEGIMTTDLYPKVRRRDVRGRMIVAVPSPRAPA